MVRPPDLIYKAAAYGGTLPPPSKPLFTQQAGQTVR